ncbi:hypothetical protein SUGI_1106110 [Cryptomeria japonica]|uniref:uncharacterized protein LOC131026725 n=1 Tax=Cryptomeria japonica TaxID=3369 RepID=UPI002414B49A|nr:uncharacterized protein LOC131026725 [Cryptomeria japonica]GLJ52030.1 hypothetical protein SUGI_1106110 [Cryptomeria japonica]
MSMMDSFFNRGGFKGARCKTALKLTIPRIKLLRNKKEVQLRQMRREIAQLLQTGQEATARIRVEHITREQNILAAYEVIELFCELVVVRLPIIETQRECPLDLKESISSLCFAAPRCSDLPELLQVQQMFAAKYGREFVMAASELRPDCGVNRQIIEKLSVRAPPAEVKLKLMKEIAEEHEVDWDSSNTEAEFFKLHEDLLDGPTHFLSGSKMPLPDEKDQSQLSVKHTSKGSNSETATDDSDLPEVTTQAVAGSTEAELAGETSPSMESSPMPTELEESVNRGSNDSVVHLSPLGSDVPVVNIESPVGSPTAFNTSEGSFKQKQFVPFISSPPPTKFPEKSVMSREPDSRAISEGNMDLQDVLAAAQAAAESADRAAAAARAAADLAKVKISELSARSGSRSFRRDDNDHILADDSKETVYSGKQSLPLDTQSEQISETEQRETDIFDLNLERSENRGESELDAFHLIHNNSNTIQADNISPPPSHPEPNMGVSPKPSGKPLYDSPSQIPSPIHETTLDQHSTHQPQRWNSMEDDYYYSYPSVFDSQNSFSERAEPQTLDKSTSDTISTTHKDHQHSFHY